MSILHFPQDSLPYWETHLYGLTLLEFVGCFLEESGEKVVVKVLALLDFCGDTLPIWAKLSISCGNSEGLGVKQHHVHPILRNIEDAKILSILFIMWTIILF